MEDINSVPIILRREIEALIAVPLIRAFMKELGKEKALAIATEVIRSISIETGKMAAKMCGGNGMEELGKLMSVYSQGDVQEADVVEYTPKRGVVHVTMCKYADLYKKLDIEEFGVLLSCGRDAALFEGFNPKIKFTRTQTIMEGGSICDFCLELPE